MKISKRNSRHDLFPAFFALICALLFSFNLYSQKTVEIDGCIVDVNNKPIRNGRVIVFYKPFDASGSDELVIETKADDSGCFFLKEAWKPRKKMLLLIEDRPEGFYPIFQRDLLEKGLFKGAIISEFEKVKHLKKLSNYIRYGQVVIDISNCSADFIYKVLSHQLYLRIKTPLGETVSEGSFSKMAYNKELKTLTFGLPEGTWYIEMVDTSEDRTIKPFPGKTLIVPYKTITASFAKSR